MFVILYWVRPKMCTCALFSSFFVVFFECFSIFFFFNFTFFFFLLFFTSACFVVSFTRESCRRLVLLYSSKIIVFTWRPFIIIIIIIWCYFVNVFSGCRICLSIVKAQQNSLLFRLFFFSVFLFWFCSVTCFKCNRLCWLRICIRIKTTNGYKNKMRTTKISKSEKKNEKNLIFFVFSLSLVEVIFSKVANKHRIWICHFVVIAIALNIWVAYMSNEHTI